MPDRLSRCAQSASGQSGTQLTTSPSLQNPMLKQQLCSIPQGAEFCDGRRADSVVAVDMPVLRMGCLTQLSKSNLSYAVSTGLTGLFWVNILSQVTLSCVQVKLQILYVSTLWCYKVRTNGTTWEILCARTENQCINQSTHDLRFDFSSPPLQQRRLDRAAASTCPSSYLSPVARIPVALRHRDVDLQQRHLLPFVL